MSELRDIVLRYVQAEYARTGFAPSIRNLIRNLRSKGLNNKKFYKSFPNGLPQVCKICGIPTPKHCMEMTRKATKTRKELNAAKVVTQDPEQAEFQKMVEEFDARRSRLEEKAAMRQKARNAALRLAQTEGGIEEIFRSNEYIIHFCEAIPEEKLDWYKSFCRMNNLDYRFFLVEAVGDFRTYTINSKADPKPFDQYVEEEIEWYIYDLEKERLRKLQQHLQKEFSKELFEARHKECGHLIHFATNFGPFKRRSLLMLDDQLICSHCGSFLEPTCPGCHRILKQEPSTQNYYCDSCNVTLIFPN